MINLMLQGEHDSDLNIISLCFVAISPSSNQAGVSTTLPATKTQQSLLAIGQCLYPTRNSRSNHHISNLPSHLNSTSDCVKLPVRFRMSNSKKRAAEDTPSAPSAKKTKKRKSKFQDESLDEALGVNTQFSRMDNQLLADHLAQKLARFGTELSPIEISDLAVSGEIYDFTLPAAWN